MPGPTDARRWSFVAGSGFLSIEAISESKAWRLRPPSWKAHEVLAAQSSRKRRSAVSKPLRLTRSAAARGRVMGRSPRRAPSPGCGRGRGPRRVDPMSVPYENPRYVSLSSPTAARMRVEVVRDRVGRQVGQRGRRCAWRTRRRTRCAASTSALELRRVVGRGVERGLRRRGCRCSGWRCSSSRRADRSRRCRSACEAHPGRDCWRPRGRSRRPSRRVRRD